MRFGLVARADDRGLATMTRDFYRHMAPDRVLLVREPGAERQGFRPHLDWYPDATVVHFTEGTFPEQVVRDWLEGLDVIYSAETMYDERLYGWARDAGCRTVLHVMPELFPASPAVLPDAIWAPTSWRLDTLPAGARVVPVPVATDRFEGISTPGDGPLRVLHVAGHRAMADRNGTQAVTRAVRMLRQRAHVTIVGQDGRLPRLSGRAPTVTVSSKPGGCENYWDLYRDQDVLLMPRRYGGLSLPVQEAMAAGLVPILPDVAPNGDWPAVLTAASWRGHIITAAGTLRLAHSDPSDLAAAVDLLATDRDLLAAHRARALEWAEAHSWDSLAPTYRTELERACDHAP